MEIEFAQQFREHDDQCALVVFSGWSLSKGFPDHRIGHCGDPPSGSKFSGGETHCRSYGPASDGGSSICFLSRLLQYPYSQGMTTLYFSLRVATRDVQRAIDATQKAGFQVRIIEELPPEPNKTDLELSIQYLSDDPHDVEPQGHAAQLRDDSLQESGVPWEHLSSGVGAGPTLSTFTMRPKGQPHHPGQKVMAANWDQFNKMCELAYGFVPSLDEYEIHIEGLAANDDPPR